MDVYKIDAELLYEDQPHVPHLKLALNAYNFLGVCLFDRPPWGKGGKVSTPFINTFPWLPFPRNGPLHLSPPL